MSVAFHVTGQLEALEAELSALWDLGCEGMWQSGAEVVAYFPSERPLPLAGRWAAAEGDYLERYYAELKPVYLDTLVIAPTHSDLTLKAGQKPLWLDPGMAFGTGHHETTRLALRALETLQLQGRELTDIGAGSGILAVAADLLGAASARGVDIDPTTLAVAEANCRLNRARAEFALGTVQDLAAGSADVLVANLFAELHQRLAPEYHRALRPGGHLLVTGIMNEKLDAVLSAVAGLFSEVSSVQEGEWSLVRAERSR